MKFLTEAPEKIWDYDQDSYLSLAEEDLKYSEMHNSERKFVHGLVRYMQPKRVLEIGVAEGGGSIVLLNAIEDIPGATLTSIDIMEKCWNDSTKDVGFACTESKINKENWHLCVGSDPVDVIKNLSNGEKFDFVIIDTLHTHPVESLNFLCVFPFLSENCTVILHDIGLYAHHLLSDSPFHTSLSNFPSIPLATKLLFDTMVGEKRTLPLEEYSMEGLYPNIGACQLNENSNKYIGNIFSMLQFPWGFNPKDTHKIALHLKEYYNDEFYQMFQQALDFQKGLIIGGGNFVKSLNTDPLHYGKKKIVLYGFGSFFKDNLLDGNAFSHHIDDVWDKFEDESTIFSRNNKEYHIKRPDYNCEAKDDLLIVLTLCPNHSKVLVQEIKDELNSFGFHNVIHYLELENVSIWN